MSSINKIYSSRCWVNGKLQPATVCMHEGIISEIHFEKHADAFDAGDKILMPGVIDIHVHINEPGRTEWEGFDTATQAAAAGGTTTVIDMPLNASPVTTTVEAFNQKLTAAENKLNVNVGYYGGLVPGNINELESLIAAGVLGIKCFLTHSGIDEFPNVTEADLDAAMPIIAKHDLPLLVHCEMEADCEHELSKYPSSYSQYLSSRPKEWENHAIEMMIRLCRKHHCKVHIVHVSSAEALPLIEAAKQEGLPITAETCPHYIYFSSENIPDAGCVYKCAPPIREKENNELLNQALAAGVLDLISTDHSPATPDLKEMESGNFLKAWGGIAGIQFLLPVSWTSMKASMSIEEFIPLLVDHPAKFLQNNKKGKIAVGYDADLLVWDSEASFVVKEDQILFRHKISPYIGEKLYGTVFHTIVNGVTVYENGQMMNKNAGRSIKKNNSHRFTDQVFMIR